MRRERLYLLDIVEAADAVERFLEGVTEQEFLHDELRRSAVLQKLTVVGEAASKLSRELCDRYPEVDWRGISGFRNIAVHEYFAVEWPIVWVAAAEETPELRRQVAAILEREFPDEGSGALDPEPPPS